MPTVSEHQATEAIGRLFPRLLDQIAGEVKRAADAAEVQALLACERGTIAHTIGKRRALILAGCTGVIDATGSLVHDGDTCPFHEEGRVKERWR